MKKRKGQNRGLKDRHNDRLASLAASESQRAIEVICRGGRVVEGGRVAGGDEAGAVKEEAVGDDAGEVEAAGALDVHRLSEIAPI